MPRQSPSKSQNRSASSRKSGREMSSYRSKASSGKTNRTVSREEKSKDRKKGGENRHQFW